MRSRIISTGLVIVALVMGSCGRDGTAETTGTPSSTTVVQMSGPAFEGLMPHDEVESVVSVATEVAVDVAAGLNEADPELFLSQFQPGATVIEPIRPNLTWPVGELHDYFRTLCTWGLEEVFVNAGGSMTRATCTGFYESVDGAPESAGAIRHLPMTDGLATGLMHRLHADTAGEYPEETGTIIGFPVSVAAEVTEQVESARSFEEKLEEAWQSSDPSSTTALYAAEGFRDDGFVGLSPTRQSTVDFFARLHETYDSMLLSVEDLYASGLGPAAIYEVTFYHSGSECSMRLGSVWNLDEDGLIDHEYVFYDPDTLEACGWWD